MERLKVLVVDDESRMRKLVKDFLVRKDFEVIEAENGAQAVDIFFEKNDISLIMLHTSPTDLTPQKEEDIFVAAWVAKSSLPPFLTNTYPSIVEVFREAKI